MQQPWQTVTTLPPLAPGELQVWRVILPEAQADPGPYTRTLTPEELARAARFRIGHVRLQFVAARAALRVLLGNLLALGPNLVALEVGPHGKPAVSGHSLRFNLAHTSGIILIAISRDWEVGIDVEQISREVEALDIARNSFSITETRELESIADTLQLHTAFFHCWTRKEATIKADGRGLSLPLASFNVPVIAEASITPVQVTQSAQPASSSGTRIFYLSDLPCSNGFAAAVAVESPHSHLRLFDFPLEILSRFH